MPPVAREVAELRSLQMAYLALLTMPHGLLRMRTQTLLCELRDHIQEITGCPDELVQGAHEQVFCFLPGVPPTWPPGKAPKTKSAARAKGGHARAASLSPERRLEIAKNAASARWKT